jgi:hypothetical protein
MKFWKGKFYELTEAEHWMTCEGCVFRRKFTDGCREVRLNVGDCTKDVKGFRGTFVVKEVDVPDSEFTV